MENLSSVKRELDIVTKKYTDEAIAAAVKNKVDKVDGKGLSTNDFTNEEKEKLASLSEQGYTLPVASSDALGGVKSGADITVDGEGNVSVNDNSHKHTASNISDLSKSSIGLGNVENKSSETIRSEITAANVTTALTYTPAKESHNHTVSQITDLSKSSVGLGNVENKSSSTIRSEITSSNVTSALGFTPMNSNLKGANSGVAELDANGKVPTSQLPSYVDDVLEYSAKASFPATGEAGKIYVDLATNLTYRWSGSAYTEISPSLALGETSSTAYRGDRGKTAYDHSQVKDGSNPHGTTFANIASKPTTLSGYGITDAKIASGVITLGSNTITPLTSSSSLDATKLTGTATINTTGKATTAGTADALKGVTATATELNILDGATLTTAELNYVDGVTSNIQTQLNNKAASSHTHNYAGSSSAGGAATNANNIMINRSSSNDNYPILLTNKGDGTTVKQDSVYAALNNTVTLNPSTGTITATKFAGDGASITGLKEGNLTWGNKALAGSITPMGMALSEEHSANKAAFINGNAITIEYSTDGGTTYTDSGISASNKSALFTKSYTVQVGGSTAMTTDNYTKLKTRITLTGQDGTNGYLYTDIKKILINANTASTLSMLVETMHGNSTSWVTYGTYNISGWSGWNDVPIITTLGGGTSQKDRPWKLRFTFSLTACNASYSTTKGIQSFRVFGQNGWTVPSTLGTTGHMYTYDMSKNVTFPATVTATTFSGSGASLTALNATQLTSGTIPAARLPVATSSALGGVKSGTDITIDANGNVSVNDSSHNHAATNITSGTLSSDRLPTVPITKGGTGATTAAGALTNLGITATAAELNYVDGVTSAIQTQLNAKAATSAVLTKTNTTSFTPSADYHPATKKYVDDKVSAAGGSSSVTVTVATTAWAADATYTGYGFKATVTATGVTASNNIVVGMSATATLEQEEACAAAGVQCKGQAANTIYLYSKTIPTVALPISVIILG